ncbi:MAG TPA: translation elongation factor Ts [Pirellulales bacterium]|jgi:elongation factor Ts|nr:translation elongation factor Ts [Pirellulales bacterium]
MAEISAAAVKALREQTGLPMMECKAALQEAGGDAEEAIRKLREKGKKTQETRLGRETLDGRIGLYADAEKKVGAMVELLCESAPVAGSTEVKQFANDLAKQMAVGGAKTADELLKLPSLSKPGSTLGEQKDDLFNRIREVFNIGRVVRFDGLCAGYVHATGDLAALVEFQGGDAATARDIAMHIVANNTTAATKEDLDPADVAHEREILTEQARKEGKPENIIQKMIEGRMKNFYAARVLTEQQFVKDNTKMVADVLKAAGMKIKRFVNWRLGK